MTKQKAVSVIVTGRVQGVFFRMETQRQALRLNIRGWVKNRRDGAVEGVFEGDEKDVDALINWCRRGSKMAMVTDVTVCEQAFTGAFADFSIRYDETP